MIPRFGIQGPVVAFQDPWAGELSDAIMRTGTGSPTASQDRTPTPEQFVATLRELGADFYVHHHIPGVPVPAETSMLEDLRTAGLSICIGNEYGNINGPWVSGTNRYDVSDETLERAVGSGTCIGLLYDEPAHLQTNVMQYRKDGWFPHWVNTDGATLAESRLRVREAVSARSRHARELAARLGSKTFVVLPEQVFPTMFHTHAAGGFDVCPKVMKESFQPLQLATALGAARQYKRAMWVCADLWGPDVGEWFTRMPGFPGHAPDEFSSALRMAYLMGPEGLFVENIDVLVRNGADSFESTEFGERWTEFLRDFVPTHPLTWSHADVDPDILLVHSDDGNYGQNERLFGNRESDAGRSENVFACWHLISHGLMPSHGSCMHIPGYEFPRNELKQKIPYEQFPLPHGSSCVPKRWVHPLFFPANNVVVFDSDVTRETTELLHPKLVLVCGSELSPSAYEAVRDLAWKGATVIIARWLLPEGAGRQARSDARHGAGTWMVTEDFLSDSVRECAEPFLGEPRRWMQRFGGTEVRICPSDPRGFTLDFEIAAD